MLGVMTKGGFEGDEFVASIPVPEVVGINIFFLNWEFIEHILIMMMLITDLTGDYRLNFNW